jgi:hypothetical protein
MKTCFRCWVSYSQIYHPLGNRGLECLCRVPDGNKVLLGLDGRRDSVNDSAMLCYNGRDLGIKSVNSSTEQRPFQKLSQKSPCLDAR